MLTLNHLDSTFSENMKRCTFILVGNKCISCKIQVRQWLLTSIHIYQSYIHMLHDIPRMAHL